MSGTPARKASLHRVARFEPKVAGQPLIEFRSPSQLRSFVPAADAVLVGDCHIVKGAPFVIGGAPGVGKSRAAVALAEGGATGERWFGLEVHHRFKTMIIQNENGMYRLSKEFAELDCAEMEDWVRVCPPPPFGLCFDRKDFRDALSAEVEAFRPDVIIIDPWNAVARDDQAKDYLNTFLAIREVIPGGDDSPSLGIVAHTRKPKAEERSSGRALLNTIAGSYVLGSVPRTAFVIQSATDDPEESRVVWTCCKNNDGLLGSPSAWERRNGLFAPVSDFDWGSFSDPEKRSRFAIMKEDVASVFENGTRTLSKAEAAKLLVSKTGASRASAYTALKPEGRFADHLSGQDDCLTWSA